MLKIFHGQRTPKQQTNQFNKLTTILQDSISLSILCYYRESGRLRVTHPPRQPPKSDGNEPAGSCGCSVSLQPIQMISESVRSRFFFYVTRTIVVSLLLFSPLSCVGFSTESMFVFHRRHLLLRSRQAIISSSSSFVSQRRMSPIPSNQELVQRRLDVAKANKEARLRSAQETHQRNLRLKRMLHTEAASGNNNNNETTYDTPTLYAVKVSVAEDLRQELKLTGREKRGRVFIETHADGCRSIKGLRYELHAFFRCLRKGTYILEASLPVGELDALDKMATHTKSHLGHPLLL